MAKYILAILGTVFTIGLAVIALLVGLLRASNLYLPVPFLLSILAVLDPVINQLAIYQALKGFFLSNPKMSRFKPIVEFAINLAALFIEALPILSTQLDTIIIALSAYQLAPGTLNCALETRWQAYYQSISRNEKAVRTIQDSLKCCGFRSVKDRAWPFPDKEDNDVYACKIKYGKKRDIACIGGWQKQEQLVLGVFIAVGICSLGSKLILYLILRYRPSWLQRLQQSQQSQQGQNHTDYAWRSGGTPRQTPPQQQQQRRLLEDGNAARQQGQLEAGENYTDEPVITEEGDQAPVESLINAEP
ncbi:MAG: hypothetical protein MMC33_004617 [Icmadophila ericetorum]|nr:hypothetical protein [Icmadophila ericetorum]